MLAPCQQQRVDQPFAKDRRPFDAVKFSVDEAAVERCVVNHQRRIRNEIEKLVDHLGKQRLARQELGGKAMHGERLGRYVTFGIDVSMKGLAGRHAIKNLDAADFDQPIAAQGIKARGFGIENDFAHGLFGTEKRRIRLAAAAS